MLLPRCVNFCIYGLWLNVLTLLFLLIYTLPTKLGVAVLFSYQAALALRDFMLTLLKRTPAVW